MWTFRLRPRCDSSGAALHPRTSTHRCLRTVGAKPRLSQEIRSNGRDSFPGGVGPRHPAGRSQPAMRQQSGVTATQRRDPELLCRRGSALGQLRAGDFGKLMISSVSPAHPGRVDTPSRGPFTETFFLPAFRWKQILDSNRPGRVAARFIGRPSAADEDLVELGPPRLTQVEARWRWPRT